MKVGITTKNDIIAKFGPPLVVWEDLNVVSYEWHTLTDWGFFIPAGYGSIDGEAGTTALHSCVLFQFDDDEKVVRFERFENVSDLSKTIDQWREKVRIPSH